MCIIAIETATTIGSVAILRDEKIIYQELADLKTTHSETIMVRIDNALTSLKIDKSEIKALSISNGPGSFTGLRIGLATAKGICTGLKVPLIVFNTLEVLAANVYGTNKQILSILDARMNEVYMSVFDSCLNIVVKSHCRAYSDFLEDLKGEYVCVGDTQLLELLKNTAVYQSPDEVKNNETRFYKALPHQNILSAASQFSLMKLKNTTFDYNEEFIHKLEPFYVRNADSQVRM